MRRRNVIRLISVFHDLRELSSFTRLHFDELLEVLVFKSEGVLVDLLVRVINLRIVNLL